MRGRQYTDLHTALKTVVVAETAGAGIALKHVRLQNGKEDFLDTLHARPNSWSTAGIQLTDFLHFIGFSRSGCPFHQSECYCRVIAPDANVGAIARALNEGYNKFSQAANVLERCGMRLPQPEGWGYFYGKPSGTERPEASRAYGDGHTSAQSKKLKQSEDDYFQFILTWIDGGSDKGWTVHIRPKHPPLSQEFEAAIRFIGGFSSFDDCPEFDFEHCRWRFYPHAARGASIFDSNTEYVHQGFDALAANFSTGLEQLLAAHALLEPVGLSFLSLSPAAPTKRARLASTSSTNELDPTDVPDNFDVAISFAGPERRLAETLATGVRAAGFQVFYDGFYPEHLWGKDLAAFFDRVYRKQSRYCVMFISREYKDRMWTTHERRSATARAISEKGNEYILPILVEAVDIDGLPPTIGHVSLAEHPIDQIVQILTRKLKQSK